jgi:starvation-inducible DNA-binding protein
VTTATPKKSAAKTTAAVIDLLNLHLATASDLASQLKQAHWNVVGEEFIALHLMFDRQVELVRGYVDEFAERARALDGVAHGTVRKAAKHSALPEFPDGEVSAKDTLSALLERFQAYSVMLTEAIAQSDEAGDLTTQDLFIEVQREIDRNAYFLRSHLR